MQLLSVSRKLLLVSVLFAVAACNIGCGPVNRERALVGSWQADSSMMAIKAAKLKQDNPSASVSDVMGGARALTNVGISLEKDKTFELFFNGVTRKGTWAFDKANGEVQLHISESKPLNPDLKIPENEKATWTAYLDEGNDKLTFYPISPEGVRMVIQSVKGTPPGARVAHCLNLWSTGGVEWLSGPNGVLFAVG